MKYAVLGLAIAVGLFGWIVYSETVEVLNALGNLIQTGTLEGGR